ncbi:hypothetical protein LIA77_05243 [Sarocladium implicatum]|nr:hypothetical protein LIA77_05243 [Sarocladium implicatum]
MEVLERTTRPRAALGHRREYPTLVSMCLTWGRESGLEHCCGWLNLNAWRLRCSTEQGRKDSSLQGRGARLLSCKGCLRKTELIDTKHNLRRKRSTALCEWKDEQSENERQRIRCRPQRPINVKHL